MATEPRPLISEDLSHQVEETARAQNCEPASILWNNYPGIVPLLMTFSITFAKVSISSSVV
jgi:hypothetical protein